MTHNTVFKVYERSNHDLWFTCYDGSIVIYEYQSKKFIPFLGNEKFNGAKIKYKTWPSIIGFKDNNVSIIMSYGSYGANDSLMYNFNLSDSTLEITKLKDTFLYFDNLHTSVYHEIMYDDYKVYFCKPVYHTAKKNTYLNSLKYNEYKYEQIFQYDSEIILQKKNSISILSKTDTTEIFIPGRITGTIKDFDENYWVTTLNQGIFKINSIDITSYSMDSLLEKDEKIESINYLGNHLIVGTNIGNYFDYNFNTHTTNKIFSNIQYGAKAKAHLIKIDDILVSNQIEFREMEKEVSVTNYRFIDYYPQHPIKIKDNLYLSIYQGINVYFLNSIYRHDSISSISNNERYQDVEVFSEDSIIYSSLKNLYLIGFNGSKKKINQAYGLDNLTVKAISKYKNNELILGTNGKGLLIDFGDTLLTIRETDGLVSDMINDVLVDQDYIIWCSTNRGLSKIKLFKDKTFRIKNFTTKNGLPSNYLEKLILHKAQVWFYTSNSIVNFETTLSPKKEPFPKIFIESIEYADQYYQTGHEFRYNQNNLNIHYLGISSNKPLSKEFYRYRLIKNNQPLDWVSTNSRSVDFTDLSPGKYQFQLSARTENGDWIEPESIDFRIKPNWTQVWWIQAIGLLIIGLLVYFFFKNRAQKKQEELNKQIQVEQLENQLKSLELDVLRGQMNPHLIYNALNSAQSLMIQDDKLKATEFINRLSKLLRSSLEYSRRDYIAIEDEINFLTNYLEIELQRFSDRFSYSIHCTEELKEELISPLLVQPLVENAVKYAYEGKKITIEVTFKELDEYYYQVIISDDGKGIEQKPEIRDVKKSGKSSLGLVILKRRMNILKENYKNTNFTINYLTPENKKGTIITLTIPYIE